VVTVEARRLPLAHRSLFVRPTAEAGQDVLRGQFRLHWTLKVSSEITRLQKISESSPAVAHWSAGAFETRREGSDSRRLTEGGVAARGAAGALRVRGNRQHAQRGDY
jgi:hypothetical protein